MQDCTFALNLCATWIEKNLSIYSFAESVLREHVGDFEDIEMIDEKTSVILVEGLAEKFGAIKALLFCVLTSVRLHESGSKLLQSKAQEEMVAYKREIEDLQKSYDILESSNSNAVTPPKLTKSDTGEIILSRSADSTVIKEQTKYQSNAISPRQNYQLMAKPKPR